MSISTRCGVSTTLFRGGGRLLMRLIHGVFSRITHSTSLKRVFASFMGLVFAELVSFMGFVSQVSVRPVKSAAIPWKPQWKPLVWQPPELVDFRGNCPGSRQPRVSGCEPKVRTSLQTCRRCAIGNAYQGCVTVPCVPVRGSVSLACGKQHVSLLHPL